MKFHQLGLIDYDENQTMTHKLVKEILKRSTSDELTIAIKAYWQIWKSLDKEIRHIEKELFIASSSRRIAALKEV